MQALLTDGSLRLYVVTDRGIHQYHMIHAFMMERMVIWMPMTIMVELTRQVLMKLAETVNLQPRGSGFFPTKISKGGGREFGMQLNRKSLRRLPRLGGGSRGRLRQTERGTLPLRH